MANGTVKPISEVKAGDQVLTAEPGKKEKEKHKVKEVIVTKTDRDYVDVVVKTDAGPKTIEFFLEKPVPLDGYVVINGNRSPCSSCMGAMRRGAQDTGSTFVYIWEQAGRPAWWSVSGSRAAKCRIRI
ncbi:hypothetical protein [Streptomyces bacillaris]|uniref:hypothetical protein n=1 Tax=Streptomyces bacillaris TaxID=68179 RepID=UPI003824B8F0